MRVKVQRVFEKNRRVDRGRAEIVRDRNGVNVAREMKVEIFHGDKLRVAAARRAAFHAENRSEARFAQAKHGAFADVIQALIEADRGHGFAFPQRSRSAGRHVDELRVRLVLEALENLVEVDLRLVVAVLFDFFHLQPGFIRDFPDVNHRVILGDIDIRGDTSWFKLLHKDSCLVENSLS